MCPVSQVPVWGEEETMFRSHQRDRGADYARITGIVNCIEAAIRDAERELKGIRGRVDNASLSAAFLFGSELESPNYGFSEASELAAAESTLVRGQERIAELEQHLGVLRSLSAVAIAHVDVGES